MRKGIATLGLLVVRCVELDDGAPTGSRWSRDVELVLAACVECHDAARPPDLSEYRTVMGCREDGEPWIRAGDPNSLLVSALIGPVHESVAGAAPDLEQWIVEGAVFLSAQAHSAGFAVPSSTSFHGPRAIADFDRCATCHEAPPELGGAIACTTCHPRAFTDERCDGCHGDGDPRPRPDPCDIDEGAAGAHELHLETDQDPAFPSIPCATCHLVPRELKSAGHFGDASPSAEARLDPDRVGLWDPGSRTCAVACHGERIVTWAARSTGGRCDRCHGNPPSDHASPRCGDCHGASSHIDLELQVGTGCTDCHDGGASGAHAAHLGGGAFAAPAACRDCHPTPEERDEPGHIDSDLPAEVELFGSGSYDDGRCIVACHGSDLDGGSVVEWEGGPVECGDCHGLPPIRVRGGAGVHAPTGSAACGFCHRTEDREPITSGTSSITKEGRAAHVDGCVSLAEGCP